MLFQVHRDAQPFNSFANSLPQVLGCTCSPSNHLLIHQRRRDYSGWSVSGTGDINGDGIDDLIIGAWGAEPNGKSRAGETYVVFGSNEEFAASFNLSTLDGSNGIVFNGIDSRDYSGWSVSGAGDINGDGIDDLIIGAFFADPNDKSKAGETYVVFGSRAFG